jgi:hypothetical protein
MTATNYIQLPPDGVGKKTRHRVVTDLVMSSVSTDAAISSTLYGATSGAVGTLVGKYNGIDATVNWYLQVTSGTFQVSESLYSGASGTGTLYGNVSSTGVTANVYSPVTSIGDAAIPENTMTIDSKGAAYTRFFEGTPQFDAWGHMQVSQMQAVGEYYHYAQDLGGRYYDNKVGSGTIQFNPLGSSMVYTTGTANGDIARRSSGQYHPYKPGVGQLIYTSIAIGDSGKANVVREWGYFDDNNGFGFRLSGTTAQVFLRSDISGTATDTVVNQANWNVNTLLSATTSDFLLDVSKSNLYWMDVQGTIGRIRLGVETADGRRITVHEFRPINNFTSSSCRILSLPMTWAQRNIGAVSSSPASTQTMRVGAGVVFSETADIQYSGQLICITPDDPITFTDQNTYVPFLSFKAKSTIPGPTVNATTMTANVNYTIVSNTGTTFTSVGALSNQPGQQFTYNGGAVTGSGTVYQNIQNSIIGIHETFDWATQGNVNLEIGIFVLPSESYLTGFQWSDTWTPETMLYVDTSATAMPNTKIWSNVATFTGYISSTTMTVTSVSSGSVLKEIYLAGGSVGTITARTKVLKQLTANVTLQAAQANVLYSAYGTIGTRVLGLASVAGVSPGQIVAGNSVPTGTVVQSVTGTNVLISSFLTGSAGGYYNFSAPGGPGTYQVDKSQTLANAVTPSTGITGAYMFKPIEAFVAPANSSGRAALGDRIQKSFGLGPNLSAPEDQKGVFVFAARPQANASPWGVSLFYTKFWKEIR